jgi:hypothetical protein
MKSLQERLREEAARLLTNCGGGRYSREELPELARRMWDAAQVALDDANEIDRLSSALAEAREVIRRCRLQFTFYVGQHLGKTPPDEAKAAANAEFESLCSAFLANNPEEK